jgi:hypothetical protein
MALRASSNKSYKNSLAVGKFQVSMVPFTLKLTRLSPKSANLGRADPNSHQPHQFTPARPWGYRLEPTSSRLQRCWSRQPRAEQADVHESARATRKLLFDAQRVARRPDEYPMCSWSLVRWADPLTPFSPVCDHKKFNLLFSETKQFTN